MTRLHTMMPPTRGLRSSCCGKVPLSNGIAFRGHGSATADAPLRQASCPPPRYAAFPQQKLRSLSIASLLFVAAASGAEVNIVLVQVDAGKRVPLEGAHELRRSPYGGWVVSCWPFGMKVNDTAILDFEEAMLKQAIQEYEPSKAERPQGMAELEGPLELEGGPPVLPGITRPHSAKVNLPDGDHVLAPGDLRFSIRDGRLSTTDPRLKVGEDGETLEVTCWPIAIRGTDGGRSVPFPGLLSYGPMDLLAGILKPLEDPEGSKLRPGESPQGPPRYCRIRAYLPSSAEGKSYRINGVPFAVDAQGKVTVTANEWVSAAQDREVRVKVLPPGPVRRIGVRWVDCSDKYTLMSEKDGLAESNSSGASIAHARVPPKANAIPFSFSRVKEARDSVSVTVPSMADEYMYKTLVFDPQSSVAKVWLVDAATFLVRPSESVSYRVTPLGGKDPQLGGVLTWFLEAAGRAEKPVVLEAPRWSGAVAAFRIPATVADGLWALRLRNHKTLERVPLALLLVARQPAHASVSVYTCRNRGGFRRGDPVDIYWTVSPVDGSPDPGPLDLVLSGRTCEKVLIARVPAGASANTGHMRLDTAALGPGTYQVAARNDSVVSYPAKFHIYQREPRTDFEVYSQAPFSEGLLDAGSPFTAYYAQGTGAGEPGLAPLADQAYGNLDAAFGVYAGAPLGPAIEKCIPPDEDEVGLMTLARLGRRAVPSMPVMLHHEEWNPKHTLPDELRRLRRRNALFTQKYADLGAFGGIRLNWYATLGGYWEESEPLDGYQARRNTEANQWVGLQVKERVDEERAKNRNEAHLKVTEIQTSYASWSLVLPRSYHEYLVDARTIRPDLTSHSAIPDFWLGGSGSYPPLAFSTLTHRDAVDYTDYGRTPWGEFRAPAFLGMDNPNGQKTQVGFAAYGRHARFITSFAAAGRGLDGYAVNPDGPLLSSDHEGLLRIFERFGSYFTALDPLPDVAVYFSKSSPWAHQKSVILHDLARIRRPGVLISQEEVLRGELAKYNVLFLAAIGDHEPKAVRDKFAEFQSRNGAILKDRTCAAWVPGTDIGFAYDDKQVPGRAWGLGGPDGEWEFAFLWGKFLSDREKPLLQAFEGTPSLPVTTPDNEILISPLAGKESICCFVTNLTYVPMSVGGKWRQHAALPRKTELILGDGWHAYDLLEGMPCAAETREGARRIPADFTRLEGRLFVLLKRQPAAAVLRTQRIPSSPPTLRVNAWLTDAAQQPVPDPVPFAVTLTGPEGEPLFHKFAALSPDKSMDVPVPAMSHTGRLKLTVQDLIAGFQTTGELDPAGLDQIRVETDVDAVGLPQIRDFLSGREHRVLVLLDENQEAYRRAADRMVALLTRRGRKARCATLDPAEVRELPLRWKPLDEDLKLIERVRTGDAIAWRVDLAPYAQAKENRFDRPTCGYPEYGPRTLIEGDVVLFGSPADHHGIEDLQEFLRRRPSENYPSSGRFFLHYVWDAFQGGNDALYIGCRDAAGAENAVTHLETLAPPPSHPQEPKDAGEPQVTVAKERQPLPNLIRGRIGNPVQDFAWSPSGRRIFVTVDSYGDSLFVLDAQGDIVQSRPVGNRIGNSVFWRGCGSLATLSDSRIYLGLWNNEYLLNLDKGFEHRVAKPNHGLPGRIRVPPGGEVLWRDGPRGRAFLAGFQQVYALDANGRLLWTYDDTQARTDTQALLYRRSTFIRGLSPNGKRLVLTAFGVEEDVYGIGTMRNNSVFCLDTENGRALWDRDGLILNEGKAIVTDDRAILIDDSGQFHLLDIHSGEPAGQFRPVRGTDYLVPIPGTESLLVVENNQFDEHGATSRIYLRAPGDSPDVVIPFGGRVTDVALTPDRQAILLCSARGQTACFGLDGAERWRTPTPTGGKIRCSPDGGVTGVGTQEGTLHLLKTRDGTALKTQDFNRFNITSPEKFLEQMKTVGDVPEASTVRVPLFPPEPSYLESLHRGSVSFGDNLLPGPKLLSSLKAAEPTAGDPARPQSLGLLDRPVVFRLQVQPRTTYLVEFLDGAAGAQAVPPQARCEVSVTGQDKSQHLPFTGRLPIGPQLARRRMAFRTHQEKEVTLSFRVVTPSKTGDGRSGQATYDKPEVPPVSILLGDVVVAAMKFQSRNFLLNEDREGMGKKKSAPPRGDVKCEVVPWRGGVSYIRWRPWDAPQSALRVTDGLLGNQETKWQETKDVSTGTAVHSANAYVTFKKPETINAVAIYEDNRGPVAAGDGVQEMVSAHYGVYIHEAKANKWSRVGYVGANMNLVNVFTFPPTVVDRIHYFWAGRPFSGATDGMVRMAELEAYSTEESDLGLDDAGGEGEEGGDGEIKMD